MTPDRKLLVLIVSSLPFSSGASSLSVLPEGISSWATIATRNVFRLKSPPPEVPPRPPARMVALTGILTIGGKRAFMKTQAPAKTGQPSSDQLYVLAVGQRDGDLEVLAITEVAGTVKVNNAGSVETLTFADTPAR